MMEMPASLTPRGWCCACACMASTRRQSSLARQGCLLNRCIPLQYSHSGRLPCASVVAAALCSCPEFICKLEAGVILYYGDKIIKPVMQGVSASAVAWRTRTRRNSCMLLLRIDALAAQYQQYRLYKWNLHSLHLWLVGTKKLLLLACGLSSRVRGRGHQGFDDLLPLDVSRALLE